MKKREMLRILMVQFFICYTFTMMATIAFTLLSTPPVTELSVSYLWEAAIFSLCAGIPTLLYFSGEELTRKQFWIRTALHTVLLEAVLMAAGYQFGMYRGLGGAVAFFFTVLIVDCAVRLFMFLSDKSTADEINRKLKEQRKQKQL